MEQDQIAMEVHHLILRFCLPMFLCASASCALMLSNYGVTKEEIENLLAREAPIGTSKHQVHASIDSYAKEHLEEPKIYKDLEFYQSDVGPGDEKIKGKRHLIKSKSSVMIPENGFSKLGATYLFLTLYFDENGNLVEHYVFEGVHK